jgi:hypothetical protein
MEQGRPKQDVDGMDWWSSQNDNDDRSLLNASEAYKTDEGWKDELVDFFGWFCYYSCEASFLIKITCYTGSSQDYDWEGVVLTGVNANGAVTQNSASSVAAGSVGVCTPSISDADGNDPDSARSVQSNDRSTDMESVLDSAQLINVDYSRERRRDGESKDGKRKRSHAGTTSHSISKKKAPVKINFCSGSGDCNKREQGNSKVSPGNKGIRDQLEAKAHQFIKEHEASRIHDMEFEHFPLTFPVADKDILNYFANIVSAWNRADLNGIESAVSSIIAPNCVYRSSAVSVPGHTETYISERVIQAQNMVGFFKGVSEAFPDLVASCESSKIITSKDGRVKTVVGYYTLHGNFLTRLRTMTFMFLCLNRNHDEGGIPSVRGGSVQKC